MTNPGLYSGIYQQIREIAELVDDVLINLKADTDKADTSSRQMLAELLQQLVAERTDTLQLRMVALLIVGDNANDRKKWERTAQQLSSGKTSSSLIEELDKLAQLLEQMQADAMAKMRGWSP